MAEPATPEEASAAMADLDAEMLRYANLLKRAGSWPNLIKRACRTGKDFDAIARDLFTFATERIRFYLLGTCEFIERGQWKDMPNTKVRELGAPFQRECHLLTHAFVLAEPRRALYDATYGAETMHTFMDHRELRYAYMREEEQAAKFPKESKLGLTSHRSLRPPSISTLLHKFQTKMGRDKDTPEMWFARTAEASAEMVGRVALPILANMLHMQKAEDMPIDYDQYYDQLQLALKEAALFWQQMPAGAFEAMALEAPLNGLGTDPKTELTHLAQFASRARGTLSKLDMEDPDQITIFDLFTLHMAGPRSLLPIYLAPGSDELHRLHPGLDGLSREGVYHPFPITEKESREYLVDLMGAHTGAVAQSFLPSLSEGGRSMIENEAKNQASLFAASPIDSVYGRARWIGPIQGNHDRVTHYEHAYLSTLKAPVCFYYRDTRAVLYEPRMPDYSMQTRANVAHVQSTALAEALYTARDEAIAKVTLSRHKHREALLRVQKRSLATGVHLNGLAEENALRVELERVLRSDSVMRYTRLYLADVTASRVFAETGKFLHELPPTHYARGLYDVAMGLVTPSGSQSSPTPTRTPVKPFIGSPSRSSPSSRIGQVAASTADEFEFKFGLDVYDNKNQDSWTGLKAHWGKLRAAVGKYYMNCIDTTMPVRQVQPSDPKQADEIEAARKALIDAQPQPRAVVLDAQRRLTDLEWKYATTTLQRKYVLTRLPTDDGPLSTVEQYMQDILESPTIGRKHLSYFRILIKGKAEAEGNVPYFTKQRFLADWLEQVVQLMRSTHEYALMAETCYAIFIIAQLCRIQFHGEPIDNMDRLLQISWGYYCIAYHRISLAAGTDTWLQGSGSVLWAGLTAWARPAYNILGGQFQPLPIDMAENEVARFVADELAMVSDIVGYYYGTVDLGASIVQETVNKATQLASMGWGNTKEFTHKPKSGTEAIELATLPSQWVTKAKAVVINLPGGQVTTKKGIFELSMQPTKSAPNPVVLFQGKQEAKSTFAFQVPGLLGPTDVPMPADGGTKPLGSAPATIPADSIGFGKFFRPVGMAEGYAIVDFDGKSYLVQIEEANTANGTAATFGTLKLAADEKDLKSGLNDAAATVYKTMTEYRNVAMGLLVAAKYADLVSLQWTGISTISIERQWEKISPLFAKNGTAPGKIAAPHRLYYAKTFTPSSLNSTGERWTPWVQVPYQLVKGFLASKTSKSVIGGVASVAGTMLTHTPFAFAAPYMTLLALVTTLFSILNRLARRQSRVDFFDGVRAVVGIGILVYHIYSLLHGWAVANLPVGQLVSLSWPEYEG